MITCEDCGWEGFAWDLQDDGEVCPDCGGDRFKSINEQSE